MPMLVVNPVRMGVATSAGGVNALAQVRVVWRQVRVVMLNGLWVVLWPDA